MLFKETIKLKRLLRTKDGKILIQNFLSLSALQMVTMLLPLITLPYVLRIIGYEKYGLIALATALVAYFHSLVDYSFKVTAVRDVSTYRNSKNKLSLIYSRVMTLKLIFLVFSLALLSLVVLIYPPFHEESKLFFYTMLSLVGFSLFPEWFFQGLEEMKYITLINVSVRILFSLGIFVFIHEESDYVLYPLLTSVGLIVSGVVGQWVLFQKFKISFSLLSFRLIKRNIFKNFPIFINQFMPNLYNNSTSFLLGVFVSAEMLGIYSAILKIIDLCMMLLNIISRVFYPFINRNRDAFTMYRNLMFSLVAVGLLVLFASNQFVFWYLDLNSPLALPVLLITGMSIVGYVLYDVYGLNYFIIIRQDKLVMKNTIYSSLTSVAFALPLIYFFGLIGAALTLFFGRFLMGGGLIFHYWKMKKANSV